MNRSLSLTEIKTEQIDHLHVMQKVETCHSQKELANEVGFSVGKVNYIIKALLQKGYIKAEKFLNHPIREPINLF